jgi:hypothetical protein
LPEDGGIHLRGPTGWRRLAVDEVRQTIRLVPSCFDFRREPRWNEFQIATKGRSEANWRLLSRRVKALWMSLWGRKPTD